MGSKGLTTVWFQPHLMWLLLSLLRGACDPVPFQREADAFLETWQNNTVHQSRLQLARAMAALGAATRYRGLHRTLNPGLRTAAGSVEHRATRNPGM